MACERAQQAQCSAHHRGQLSAHFFLLTLHCPEGTSQNPRVAELGMAQEVTCSSEKLGNLSKATQQSVAGLPLEHRAPESQTCPWSTKRRLDQQMRKQPKKS